MAHRIEGYAYFEDNSDGCDVDAFYGPFCDGLVEDERDIKMLIGSLWWLFREGKKPIVAIFLPEGDEMEQTIDKETGEIKDGTFVEIQPMIAPSGAEIDLTRDAKIQKMLSQIVDLERWSDTVVVDSLDAEKKATNDLVIIGNIEKEIEERRKELVKPHNDYVNYINSTVKKLLGEPLSAANQRVRNKILGYKKAEKDKVEAIERANMARVNEALAEARANNAPIALPDIQKTGELPSKTVRAALGTSTSTSRRMWRWKEGLSHAERMAGLPSQYQMANEKLINTIVSRNKQLTDADFGNVLELYEEDTLRVMGRKAV